MSEITLNLLCADRSVYQQVHGSVGDAILAALAADPETIDELESAVGRFQRPPECHGLFEHWKSGTCHERWDAGIVYIDLAARLVVSRSSWSEPGYLGSVRWHDGHSSTNVQLSYCLADEWMFSHVVEEWAELSQQRRQRRSDNPPLETRCVMYERLAEHLVYEVDKRRTEFDRFDDDALERMVREIHADWLLTARHDLRGDTPRDVLLARREHIDLDLHNQGHRWSCLREPPPRLDRECTAYRCAGFGTHEIVLYFDLVRYLLFECVDQMIELPDGLRLEQANTQSAHFQAGASVASTRQRRDPAGMIELLGQLCQEWLNAPQDELHGHSAAYVIDLERGRLPLTVSDEDVVVDHDCPLCQMMADDKFGPTFWHLDGCNLDDDFAFSFHHTREDWEEEQQEWENFSRSFEEKQKRDQEYIEGQTELDEFLGAESTTWTRSYSNAAAFDCAAPGEAVPLMLFGIGAHLGELGDDLQAIDNERAKTLRANFVDVRHSIDKRNPWSTESAVARFAEELQAVGKSCPDLAEKCANLESQVDRLLQRCRELPDFDDDCSS